MLKLKVKTKRSNKTKNILKNLKILSNNTLQVGHFKESGTHGDSDLTYPELLKIWHFGLHPSGVKKSPLANFIFTEIHNKKFLSNPLIRKAYKKWSSNLDKETASKEFLEDMGRILRKGYSEVFGTSGKFMPIVGANTTPMYETGELARHTAYKTSLDNQVKEIGNA